MTGETLLAVEGLCAWYGGAQILFDVALGVGRGEVVALMGRNGAGKSTTMKSIMGLVGRRRGWRPMSRFSRTVRSAKMRRSSGVKPRPSREMR